MSKFVDLPDHGFMLNPKKMSAGLFSEFSPSDKTSWQKMALTELKGKVQILSQWQPAAGLIFDPYLTRHQLDEDKLIGMQNAQRKNAGWINMPATRFTEAKQTNLLLKDALQNGADAVLIDLTGIPVDRCELPKLLHGIRLSDHAVFLNSAEDSERLFTEISKHAGYYLKGGIAFDPLAAWMRTGNAFEPYFDRIARLITHTRNMREFRPSMVETHIYHNSGADPVQELAFTIASAATHMDLLTGRGLSPLLAFNRTFVSVSVGTQHLTEIAKLRALRLLLQSISRAYKLPDELCVPFIHASTSEFYQTAESAHTNIVRATSEAMSAVIGGCDALTVLSHDQQIKTPDAFSARVARNVSSVMAAESLLDRVADPAAGSYALEDMSVKLAEAAWAKFVEIEEQGGLVRCFENGIIQRQLRESLQEKADLLHSGQVMVGVNRFCEAPRVAKSESAAPEQSRLRDHNLSTYFHAHTSFGDEA
jgi:methylmalonyl-CoA mutase